MKILIFSSEQFKEVADITKPYVKGDVMYKGLPSNDNPSHWGTSTFNNISRITAGYCLEALESMKENDLLLYCDSDVLMIENPEWFEKKIGDNDFIFQSDEETYCMGFFIVRNNERTRNVIKKAIDAMVDDSKNYQVVFNEVAKDIKCTMFDTKDVWNYGCLGKGIWNGEEFEIPNGIKAFHANYTIGIENKVKLLNMVINKYF